MSNLIFLILLGAVLSVAGAEYQVPGFPSVSDSSATIKDFKGVTYLYFKTQKMNWMKAHLHCLNYGLQLVDLPTKDSFDWVAKELIASSEPAHLSWTAINDLEDEGKFTNLYNGRPHSDFYNAESYPDEKSIGKKEEFEQNCVEIQSWGSPTVAFLNDVLCDTELPFICSFDPASKRKTECETCSKPKECGACPPPKTTAPIGGGDCDACMKQIGGGGTNGTCAAG